jgi:hypothetical protein
MSVLKPEGREKLFILQQGRSPITGVLLDRKKHRLETHHKKDKWIGGTNELINLQLIPIEEHLLAHFLKSKDESLSSEERVREIDVVLGRMNELSVGEKKEFYRLVMEKTGIVVRFIKLNLKVNNKNMFIDKAKLAFQALKLKKALESEITEMEENGIIIKVTGDQKIKYLSVNGAENKILIEVINKGLKKSQEAAAKKMKDMGGLDGLI